MSDASPLQSDSNVPAAAEAAPRRRPKPGERRTQILQTLASMLEQPGADRVTTAALAARLEVSEAALYRHFASKAQMFEGLIEFIESSIFTLVNQITEREGSGLAQAQKIVSVLLQFGERNPGMARVMVGDALVYENERLVARMNQFFDRIESSMRQCLRQAAEEAGSSTPTVAANAQASVFVSFVIGRLQRYARSGFKREPTEQLEAALRMLGG
ncbi:nucleoid occlusion factor SlmA [Pelomonas sp. V22]|uniref:nucleoid occlusion factor SlmA n=1 Tax=Pelomonas sp. V22 TaxID=2822139 RepID=UPI0024A8E025|nr:nucleoid occlusion factor SlmA [Pelomonas sp. V22]MDI4635375.1 nucleoid occlusion factor SlmA [Pelomonas sp. V22]